MQPSVTVFLSTVTDEFEPKDKANGVAYRSRLSQICERPNVSVKIQEDFIAGSGPTLDKLDDYILASDAVVHVVGSMTGAMAHPAAVVSLLKRYPDLADRLPALRSTVESGSPELSYTQWEAYLAILHGKKLTIAKASDSAPRGKIIPPDDPQRESQKAHLARLKTFGLYPEITFNDVNDLAAQVAYSALFDLLATKNSDAPRKPSNIPFTTLGELFKGRDEFLEKVRSGLESGEHVSAIVGTQAVHGLGGLGKTRAAVEYGLRHAEQYSALLFVSADRPEALQKSLAELCGPLVLNLPEQDVPEQSVRFAAAIWWLQKNPGWFLILDKVDDAQAAAAVEELLPHLRAGHVLITSRFGEWSGGVERLDLEVLTPAASIDFLQVRTKRRRRIEPNDETAVKELATELDGLPLALEQAAAFIVAKTESFAGYLARWRAHERKVRSWHDPIRMQYPRSVAVTWDTSFEQLDTDSRTLLNYLSWFAPAPIPVTVALSLRARKAEDPLNSDRSPNSPAPTAVPTTVGNRSPSESTEDRQSYYEATGPQIDVEEAIAGLAEIRADPMDSGPQRLQRASLGPSGHDRTPHRRRANHHTASLVANHRRLPPRKPAR